MEMLAKCFKMTGDRRARNAIERFYLQQSYTEPTEQVLDQSNKLWLERKALGCRSCGTFQRFASGQGYCRRCFKLLRSIQLTELEVGLSFLAQFHRYFISKPRVAFSTAMSFETPMTDWGGRLEDFISSDRNTADRSLNPLDRVLEAEAIKRVINRLVSERGISTVEAVQIISNVVDVGAERVWYS